MAGYKQRVFHGTTKRWQGGFPRGDLVGSQIGEPWYGGEFYAASTYDAPKNFYMEDLEKFKDNGGRVGKGTVYALDIDPDDFFFIDKSFNQQSPKVQKALKEIAKNNLGDFLDKDLDLKILYEAKDPRWNKLMDTLYPYGVKGIHYPQYMDVSDGFVFRYAKDAPVVVDTNRGTDLIPELNQPTNKVVREATPKYTAKKMKPNGKSLTNIAKNIMKNPVVKSGGKVMGALGALSSLAGVVEGASGTGRGIMPTLGGLYGGTETAKLLKQGVNPRVMTQMNYESFNLNTPEDWKAYREALKRVPVNYNR